MDFVIRSFLWVLVHTFYRIRIMGREHVPFRGPALIVCNRLSHVNALLVRACLQRNVHCLIREWSDQPRVFRWLHRLTTGLPVSGRHRTVVADEIDVARAELREGRMVCISTESTVGQSGNVAPFKQRFESIVADMDVPVVPVYLDHFWKRSLGITNGNTVTTWLTRIPHSVTLSFGNHVPAPASAGEVRQIIQELSCDAADHHRKSDDLLHRRFIRVAKRRWFSTCMTDASGRRLTYGQTLVGGLLVARWLAKQRPGEPQIGVLLPSSIAGALANLAVSLAGRAPVNLNFTAGREALNSSIAQCDIRTIITSRTYLAKAKLDEQPGMVLFEDIVSEIGLLRKVSCLLAAALLPYRTVAGIADRAAPDPQRLATVIFSSGSTGAPKGVMLSHHNVLSNIESLAQIFWLTRQDRVLGALPFFHSFGFTGTLWFPLLCGFGAVYHPNPLDAKALGELVAAHEATILISTPTFYSAYLRKCTKEQFATIRYAMVGAEKLREPLAAAFRMTYGIDLLEGYGCTEMSPVVAVNVPNVDRGLARQPGFKPGTVGHPIPGVAVRVVDPETHTPLPVGSEGLLLVKGANRMMGYIGQDDQTSEVLHEGWYITGDIGSIDEEGFLRITDRCSRFSKIAGEMVPHLKVEEAINEIAGDHACVVTGIPDEQRGERLIVLYTRQDLTAEVLWTHLTRTALPKLWIPRRDSFFLVDTLPALGTGKIDLRKVQEVGIEKARSQAASVTPPTSRPDQD